MIIKVEEVFESTFSDLQIEGLDKLNFGYGDEMELDEILLLKRNKQKAYPLLWYMMPNKISIKRAFASGNFVFLLAHNTKLDWLNDQRFKNSYDTVLYPYLEEILKACRKSRRISTIDDEYSATNYPNYTKTLKKTEQVDYWDAIKIEIQLNINNGNNC